MLLYHKDVKCRNWSVAGL